MLGVIKGYTRSLDNGVCVCVYIITWGLPKIRATFSGVPIIRFIVLWGLYWGGSITGNYHIYI